MSSPSLNIGGVTCTIDVEAGVTEESPADGGPTADVVFKCAYGSRYALVKALRGYVTTSGKSINYHPPYRYPPSPNLVCSSIGTIRGLQPKNDGSGWLVYKTAYVPAHFSVPTWTGFADQTNTPDPSGQMYCTTKFKVSSEVFSPPGGSYYYTAGTNSGQAVEESSIGIIRSRVEISMTRHKFPFVPLNAIMGLEGAAVNSAAVTFADKTFPRGCLLFGGMTSDPQPDAATGDVYQELEFTFLGNSSVEWNAFMDRKGAYQLVNSKADGTGSPPFGYFSFDALFGLLFS
jgi:hypothetical protein